MILVSQLSKIPEACCFKYSWIPNLCLPTLTSVLPWQSHIACTMTIQVCVPLLIWSFYLECLSSSSSPGFFHLCYCCCFFILPSFNSNLNSDLFLPANLPLPLPISTQGLWLGNKTLVLQLSSHVEFLCVRVSPPQDYKLSEERDLAFSSVDP